MSLTSSLFVHNKLLTVPSSLYFIQDLGDPSYVCSPQSTIIAIIIVAVFLNTGFVAGAVFFYRTKRNQWTKLKEVKTIE
jgi:hypothetical protein